MKDDNYLKPYEIFSLPPGFIYITYNPDIFCAQDLRMSAEMIEEWTARGYWGGLMVPEGTKFNSLSDELLADIGLQRIKR